MGLPMIDVIFKTLAQTAVTRSQRGVLAVVVQDGTGTFDSKGYSVASEVDKSEYTAGNYAAIQRAFAAGPYKVIVVRVAEDGDMKAAATVLDKLMVNWICAVPQTFQEGVVSYAKAYNETHKGHKVKALVCGQTAVDDMHVVNVPNTDVTAADGTKINMADYLPRLGGVLAACPMTEAVTYYGLTDLSAVAEVEDPGKSVDDGNMALFNDEGTIRIARGVTTLQTITNGKTSEDMKKITVVEGLDLIQEDITNTFKTRYVGKFKNKADNQALFVSAVLSYFRALEKEDVLDEEFGNTAAVDVEAQKAAWEADGTDTSAWDDATAKKRTYKSKVFLAGDAKILDAMEDLTFNITLV